MTVRDTLFIELPEGWVLSFEYFDDKWNKVYVSREKESYMLLNNKTRTSLENRVLDTYITGSKIRMYSMQKHLINLAKTRYK